MFLAVLKNFAVPTGTTLSLKKKINLAQLVVPTGTSVRYLVGGITIG